jgi:hypothetical protein
MIDDYPTFMDLVMAHNGDRNASENPTGIETRFRRLLSYY